MIYRQPQSSAKELCYHCGEPCEEHKINSAGLNFCCEGCRTVFELLNDNNLCTYYQLSDHPGNTVKTRQYGDLYAILDQEEVASSFYAYRDHSRVEVIFYLPGIHCSSCIYLLEKLHKIRKGILSATVNFQRKEVHLSADPQQITLREIAETLHDIGYEPYLSLKDSDRRSATKKLNRTHIYKIGISGFCFGNIMMLSFPEYFSLGEYYDQHHFKTMFAWMNFGLSLPVLLYCASEFFQSALAALRKSTLNIDGPIALAILITFLRSVYEIATQTGAGYFDSMTGIVFFMLVGRYFQNKTFERISFERDYKSYFPLGVTIIENGKEVKIPLKSLQKGQKLKVRNQELIPADAVITRGDSNIDYSFVTGESIPVFKTTGEIIYAGGRHMGSSIELEVLNDVSHAYLTSLWNKNQPESGENEKASSGQYIETINKYFSYVLLIIAAATAALWMFAGKTDIAINALTSILIVACPCALLLSATFANGNIIQLLSQKNLYLKNAATLEKLSLADTIVFDKTGTLTMEGKSDAEYEGPELNETEKASLYALANESNHPLSQLLAKHLFEYEMGTKPENFHEEAGNGISGQINGDSVKIGNASFVNWPSLRTDAGGTIIYFSIGENRQGFFRFRNIYRPGVLQMIRDLSKKYDVYLLSGDHDYEKQKLAPWFGGEDKLYFEQKPEDKLNFVKYLENSGKKVLMLGDGLNDAGALMAGSAGISVSDNINNFSPACNGILESNRLHILPSFLKLCKDTRIIVMISFAFSIIYNIIGLYFALQGKLEPVIAAILMPASSISIVVITTLLGTLMARIRLK